MGPFFGVGPAVGVHFHCVLQELIWVVKAVAHPIQKVRRIREGRDLEKEASNWAEKDAHRTESVPRLRYLRSRLLGR